MSLNHLISISACVLIAVGIRKRRNRGLHMRIMITAFVIDLLLVGWIEWTRHAVEKSLALQDYPPPGPLLAFHVAVSVMTLVFYVVQLTLGMKIANGAEHRRHLHRNSGGIFVILRLTNLVTSFLIV